MRYKSIAKVHKFCHMAKLNSVKSHGLVFEDHLSVGAVAGYTVDGGNALRGQTFGHGALIKKGTFMKKNHFVTEPQREVKVMKHNEDRLVGSSPKQAHDFNLVRDIKIADRLIHQQHWGLLCQRSGNHHPL